MRRILLIFAALAVLCSAFPAGLAACASGEAERFDLLMESAWEGLAVVVRDGKYGLDQPAGGMDRPLPVGRHLL